MDVLKLKSLTNDVTLFASHLSSAESCKRPSRKMAHVVDNPSTLTLIIISCSSLKMLFKSNIC